MAIFSSHGDDIYLLDLFKEIEDWIFSNYPCRPELSRISRR